MNRSDLKRLAEMRLSDAKSLLDTRRNNAGAYYMAGYAVECAIKACIARNQGQYPFPQKLREKDVNSQYYTHDVEVLMDTAGLRPQLSAECLVNPVLQANWALVGSWNEQFRYETAISRKQAENLIKAIEDPKDGVLAWLKNHW
jgi:HEPN domain-containing protein